MHELGSCRQRESFSWMQPATKDLVWVFFLNGVIFHSGQGRGQWVVPVCNVPSTGFVMGGSTAGFAQLGIVICLIGGCQGNWQGDTGCWSGWWARGIASVTMQGIWSIWGAGWYSSCCSGIVAGFGGSTIRRAHCGALSHWGSGYGFGCSVLIIPGTQIITFGSPSNLDVTYPGSTA